ncbi:MAG: hypothetical protein R3B82_26535 [Sandaracinaceae bacterium]
MWLRVHFDPPGFFLNDPRLSVRLGDRTLYEGSFKSGFDVSVEIPPGRHRLETAIDVAGLARKQTIELPLEESGGYRDVPEVHAQLAYSRFWGNFEKRASLSVKR